MQNVGGYDNECRLFYGGSRGSISGRDGLGKMDQGRWPLDSELMRHCDIVGATTGWFADIWTLFLGGFG